MDNMIIQPKLELDPSPMVTINDNMTIQTMVTQLRVTNVWEDYDKIEEILLSREKKAKQEIGQLKERIEMERLAKVHALEEFKKREEMCEKGKKIKKAYETLLKKTKFAERESIDKMKKMNAELESEVFELKKLKDKCVEVSELRKKNGELESGVLGFRKLKDKLVVVSDANAELRKINGELEREVSELRKVNQKWVEVSDLNTELVEKKGELLTQVCELRKLKGKLVDENTELRSMICVLEGERNTLVSLVSKDDELEEKVKKNVATIDELRKQNKKLEDEKCKYEKMVESLGKKFEELQIRVVKLEDDTERLMTVDVSAGGGNNEEELFSDNEVTMNEKDEGDVHDNEFGNDHMEDSLQRNEEIHHSLGAAAGTGQLLSKVIKEEKGSSLARGRLESQKVVQIIDLDDDDDDECTSRLLHGKKAVSGATVKNVSPSSSKEIRQKNSFSKQSLEMMRNISFSSSDTSASSGSSASSFNLDELPISPAQLQAKRRKTT